ncbi:MAG TPA: hypothetical protein VG893_02110 [Terracidiphilus sp.]|nr:hypothetical protein [Terracidiphilus sp.]
MNFRRNLAPQERTRIDSWKEIAAFFGRDERTVKRWEKERALPVHRLPGERGGVFAYTDELTGWLHSTSPTQPAPGVKRNPASVGVTAIPEESTHTAVERPTAAAADTSIDRRKPRLRARLLWGAIGACLILVTAAGLFAARHYQIHRIVKSTAHVPDAEAVQYYLRGRYYWYRRTSGSLSQALDAFTQAVVHDSEYAQAYAGLAESYDLMPEYTPMPKAEAFPRAIAAANKALALDDTLSEAHAAKGFAQFYWEWNAPGAFHEFHRALQLDPSNADARHWYATSLLSAGRNRESLSEINRAQQLDPASRSILADQALIRYWNGDRAGAISTLREIEQNEPDYQSPPRYLAGLAFEAHDFQTYLVELKRYVAISNDPRERVILDAATRGWRMGRERGLLNEVRKVEEQIFERNHASGFELARTCTFLGRRQEAVAALKAAFHTRDYQVMSIPWAEWARPLHSDPEFQQMSRQISAMLGSTGMRS